MKIVRTASGKRNLKMSRKEWIRMGRKAGWLKQSQIDEMDMLDPESDPDSDMVEGIKMETEIDYGENVSVPATIVYSYEPAGVDNEGVDNVEIDEILVDGQNIKGTVLAQEPGFEEQMEEMLIEYAKIVLDRQGMRSRMGVEEEPVEPETMRIHNVPDATEFGTDVY